MSKYIRTLTVFYDTEISYRGYHSHTEDDTFRHFSLSSQAITSISMPLMVREWRSVWGLGIEYK